MCTVWPNFGGTYSMYIHTYKDTMNRYKNAKKETDNQGQVANDFLDFDVEKNNALGVLWENLLNDSHEYCIKKYPSEHHPKTPTSKIWVFFKMKQEAIHIVLSVLK